MTQLLPVFKDYTVYLGTQNTYTEQLWEQNKCEMM